MDVDLASELREATDELLDLGPVQPSQFPASPHLQQRRKQVPTESAATRPVQKAPTFSKESKLEVLHSPTDVRPWQWPVPREEAGPSNGQDGPGAGAKKGSERPIKIEIGQTVLDDADDKLPERGLSSRVESVKAGTSKILLDSGDGTAGLGLTADSDAENRAASPSKLRIRTPINDVYINQYGERVVNGKVVGRTLGGRPRPASRTEHSPQTTTDSLIVRTATPSLLSSPMKEASAHEPTSASTTSPPAFFLESFPNAFSPAPSPALGGAGPSSPPCKKKERRPSKGRPPSMLKAPRAVAGALTLAHSDDLDDAPLLPDTSFATASDFGSPSSLSSKQLSPRIKSARSVSSSSRRTTDTEIESAFRGLQLHNGSSTLLSPTDEQGASGKLGLPLFRKPTPTIELSSASAEAGLLHGNRRQARASGLPRANSDDASIQSSRYASPAVSPPNIAQDLPSPHASFVSTQTNVRSVRDSTTGEDERASLHPPDHTRHGSASEPSSPLLSPRRTSRPHSEDELDLRKDRDEAEEEDEDKASLESAPSSLISLPVSTLTSSSRTPSSHSLERRRSSSSHHRRRSFTSHASASTFAREVSIRSWSEVGSQARGWVVFELRILTKQGTPIIAHKRFSSFVKLRQTLKEECKEKAKWLPELPTRRTGLLSKYDARYLEKRRRALQRWLEVVAMDRVWGGSEGLREWVLASD